MKIAIRILAVAATLAGLQGCVSVQRTEPTTTTTRQTTTVERTAPVTQTTTTRTTY